MKWLAAALGCLAICALPLTASASAAQPVGMVEEFYVSGWAYSPTPGPDGDVWFSLDRDPVRIGDTAIGRITPQGKTTLFKAGLDRRSAPGAMVLGPDGNLWFADDGKRPAIGRITPAGTITEFGEGPSGVGGLVAPIVGPDGDIWTVGGSPPRFGRVSSLGAISRFSAGLSSQVSLLGPLAAGPDGNVWFTARGGRPAVGRVTPSGGSTYEEEVTIGIGLRRR
jgi:streptogramin lyase